MTTEHPFLATYQRQRQRIEQVFANNRQRLFTALKELDALSVHAEFDGEGDSGGFTDITAARAEGNIPLPNTLTVSLLRATYDDANPLEEEVLTLPQAIEELCCDYLQLHFDGWEINEGAYGTFVFDIPAAAIQLQFHQRVCDVHSTFNTL